MGAIGVFGHSSLAAMGTASDLVVHNGLVPKVFTGASSRATRSADASRSISTSNMHLDTDPLLNLPNPVRSALLKAGWIPGALRGPRPLGTLVAHSNAERILAELHGLEVMPFEEAGRWRKFRVCFGPEIARGYEDEIRELGVRLNAHVAPIANVGNGVAIMLISDTGHILLLGYAESGVLLAGSTFGEAMQKTLAGEGFRTVCFTGDGDGRFWNEEFDYDDPTNYHPGPTGLRGPIPSP